MQPPSRRRSKCHSAARYVAGALALAATLIVVSTAAAHDFWLIPHMFAFANDSIVQVNGKSGTGFPDGSAVQPARVADAWMLGSSGRTRITDMSVEDNSLRLRRRPDAAGQYLIAVGLTPRTTRGTPAGLTRYLRAEGGASEAARLERENVFAGHDSVVYTAASYAATVMQVGRGGPRAYSLTAGFPLEFVPLNDPAHVHVGDSLHVRIVGGGKPVPGIGVDVRTVADTMAPVSGDRAAQTVWTTLSADANGVVHIALPKAGPWLLRSAWVGRRMGGAANEWDVARTTYVFGVAGKQ